MQLEFLFLRRKKSTRPASRLGKRREKSKKESRSSLLHDQEMTSECVRLLTELGLDSMAGNVKVLWNQRMRTTAGRAFWPEGKIEMNPKLEQIAPDEIRQTMLHELAHLVAYERAGRKRISAHGPEWRQACADLGIPGERATHSLPLPGRKMKRRWRYSCPACGEGFDRVRKMKRYAGCYPCCLKHNGGYYHKDFRLVETSLGQD
ncbi:MAG: SprT-like domain-containing protein [Akkermansiaceae bacterium]